MIEPPEVPTELRALDHWVLWRPLVNYPMSPHGGVASSTDPKTWASFEQAVAFGQTGDKLALATAHGLVSIDLDGCVKDGEVHPEAQVIVDHLDTYTEISKSGKGLHILGWGKLNSDRHSTSDTPWRELHLNEYGDPDHCDFEVYDSGRLITITGDSLPGHAGVNDIDEVLPDVIEAYLPAPKPESAQMRGGEGTMDAHAVLASARASANAEKFTALYDHGDINLYDGDHSRADMALISMLVFWTADEAVLYELFCDSALYQPDVAKRGEKYIMRTIRRAVERCPVWFGMDDEEEDEEVDIVEEKGKKEKKKKSKVMEPGALEFQMTDLGNAKRFKMLYGDYVRYQATKRRWYCWNDKLWAPDQIHKVERWAITSVRRWEKKVAAEWAPSPQRAEVFKWLNASESNGKKMALLDLAKHDESIAVGLEDFDTNPWAINVQNGILDLKTGELRPHDPAEMHSKITRGAYDLTAECPVFTKFVHEVIDDDELLHYVQKFAGYSLCGDIGENIMAFLHGPGGNGKTVFVSAIRYAMGDYATEAPPDLLMKGRRDQHPTVIAGLQGYRLVTTQETDEGSQLSIAELKRLTGEPVLKARLMHKDNVEFQNVSTFWLSANDKPEVTGVDEAVWRRVKLIPFEFEVPAEDRDPELLNKLKDEADGILSWMIEGAMMYQDEGMTPEPKAVQVSTEDWRKEGNPLVDWVEDSSLLGAILNPMATTPASDLHEAYEQWARQSMPTTKVRNAKAFATGLTLLGCTPRKGTGGVRLWDGIKLRQPRVTTER